MELLFLEFLNVLYSWSLIIESVVVSLMLLRMVYNHFTVVFMYFPYVVIFILIKYLTFTLNYKLILVTLRGGIGRFLILQ